MERTSGAGEVLLRFLVRLAPSLLPSACGADSLIRGGVELASTAMLVHAAAASDRWYGGALLEAGAGLAAFFWLARFGAPASPAIMVLYFMVRFLTVRVLAGFTSEKTMLRTALALAGFLGFDALISCFFPYLGFYPCFLGFAAGPVWLGGVSALGFWPTVVFWSALVMVLAYPLADFRRKARISGLVLAGFLLAGLAFQTRWNPEAERSRGWRFYALAAPRLYEVFEDADAGAAFHAELLAAMQLAEKGSIAATAEGFFPRMLQMNAPKLPLAMRRFVNTEALWGVHFQAPGNRQPPLLYNGIVHLTPAGVVTEVYFKKHLIPFGEYLPEAVRGTLVERTLSAVGGEFAPDPGSGTEVLHLQAGGGLKIAPRICVENAAIAAWPGLRAQARHGKIDVISVHADGSRFRSGNFDVKHFLWSRLLSAYAGCPVIHFPAQGEALAFLPSGSVRVEKIVYQGRYVLGGYLLL